jgi:hypothetical protein
METVAASPAIGMRGRAGGRIQPAREPCAQRTTTGMNLSLAGCVSAANGGRLMDPGWLTDVSRSNGSCFLNGNADTWALGKKGVVDPGETHCATTRSTSSEFLRRHGAR